MYGSTARKPVVSSRSNLKRVLDHTISQISAQKTIRSYEEESKSASEYLNLLFDSDRTIYVSIEQRLSWSMSESGFFREHLERINMRILVSRHLTIKVPSEPVMRFACTHARMDVLAVQLDAGYHANAFIYMNKDSKTLTTPLITALAFPGCVSLLVRHGADINKRGHEGLLPIEHAIQKLRGARKKPILQQDWFSDMQKEHLPMVISALLKKGCTRPRTPELRSSSTVAKTVKLIARSRWARIKRLAHTVGVAAQVLNAHLQHARFAPGGEVQLRIKRNWDECCATETDPSKYDVDGTEYFLK